MLSLELADGQKWGFYSDSSAKSWVEALASIMKLKAGQDDEYNKIIFSRKGADADEMLSADMGQFLNLNGRPSIKSWIRPDLKDFHFVYSKDRSEIICRIGEEEDRETEIVKMLMALLPIYGQTIENGGLPIHAALVEKEGKGILLGGEGGRGKSTCCRRIPHPWHALGDDEAIIVKNKKNQYVVHPFPTWSEYLSGVSQRTWDVQRSVNLTAIFFLEQSETDEVLPLGRGKSTILINESAGQVYGRYFENISREERRKVQRRLFHNAADLSLAVPSFVLRVNRNGSFWDEVEKVLP